MQTVGYVQSDNIAPRGGKHGEIYRVKKYFTTKSLTRKRDADVKALNKKLASVLKSEKSFEFSTVSDVGSFKIDGELYQNFFGDGMNRVEVCKCHAGDFKTAEILSRRQVYNLNEPITIVKYASPKTIIVSKCDCDDSFGSVSIDGVLGFCIWERKLKIFISE